MRFNFEKNLDLKVDSLCCPSLKPQMRGGLAPPLLVIVKLSTLQLPTVPAWMVPTSASGVAFAVVVADAGLAIVWVCNQKES